MMRREPLHPRTHSVCVLSCETNRDAICVLRKRSDELVQHWRYLLVDREMNDRVRKR
jgi:hypothetical protein